MLKYTVKYTKTISNSETIFKTRKGSHAENKASDGQQYIIVLLQFQMFLIMLSFIAVGS